MKKRKEKNVKLVAEVKRDKVRNLIYAAWLAGYYAHCEGFLPNHHRCVEERAVLNSLVEKDL